MLEAVGYLSHGPDRLVLSLETLIGYRVSVVERIGGGSAGVLWSRCLSLGKPLRIRTQMDESRGLDVTGRRRDRSVVDVKVESKSEIAWELSHADLFGPDKHWRKKFFSTASFRPWYDGPRLVTSPEPTRSRCAF